MIEWKSYLEFARTNAQYNDFIRKFGPTLFPIAIQTIDS
jgi:hypothetical protein